LKGNRKRRISDDFFQSAKEFVLAIDLKLMYEILALLCISRCDHQAILKNDVANAVKFMSSFQV